jgi:hypothetical protein
MAFHQVQSHGTDQESSHSGVREPPVRFSPDAEIIQRTEIEKELTVSRWVCSFIEHMCGSTLDPRFIAMLELAVGGSTARGPVSMIKTHQEE